MLTLDENAKILSEFGLTHNQAKVYITLAQLGVALVRQVSKASKVRREDVYRMLPKLEKMGLIEKILGKPIRIRATPVEEALSLLINHEKDIVNKKVKALMAKKDKFLKNFEANTMVPVLEEAHFSLISEREAIIGKQLIMVKNAERAIDVITSRDKLLHIFKGYVEPFREAIKKGVKVRIILPIVEHEASILRILEERKSSGASLHIKYTDQPSSHCVIKDYKEALVATSTEPTIGENPYLWTDDNNLVGLLQKNFEDVWRTSANSKTIETKAVAKKAIHSIKRLRPTNHVVFLYESSEAKYNVLFNYLKAGLENGEAAVYIASEESPSQIRDAMKRFGIDVEKSEKAGALRILSYDEYYIIEEEFNVQATMRLLKKMHNEAMTKGFKGLRGAGEMACFFEHNLIQELIEYESALHRVFDIPIIGICAYNTNMLIKAGKPIDLYNELLKAHGKVLFTAREGTETEVFQT